MKAPQIVPVERVAIGGVFAVCVGLALSPAAIEDGPVLCPFRLVTGLPCPACGLTRSWVYASHGWWGEALVANPFGVLALAALLVLGVGLVVLRMRRTAPPQLDTLLRSPVALLVLGAWGIFGLARMISAAT